MQLVRYNPFDEILTAQKALDRMLDASWSWPLVATEDAAMDMYTENGKLTAEIALPTFNKEEVKVVADSEGLEVTAEHKEKEEKGDKRSYLLHDSSRSYRRRVSLPSGADTNQVAANFADGKLVVTMPFAEAKKATEIAVT